MYDPTKNTGYPGPPAYPVQQPMYGGAGVPSYGYPMPPMQGMQGMQQPMMQQGGFASVPPVGFYQAGPQDISRGPMMMPGPSGGPSGPGGSARDPENQNQGDASAFGGSFGDKAIRQAFVRKVYSILSVQLLFTLGFIAICIFVADVKFWLRRNVWAYYISYVFFLGTYIALMCCPGVRRKHPTNLIVMAIFTCALTFMTGMISSFHNTQIVLMAIGITAGVTICVSLFAINTKYDVTGCGMFLFVATLVLFIFGIATMIVFFVDRDSARIMQVVYGGLMALLFSMYLMYDTQQIMGGRKIEISPEEHIYGAIQLYVDVVYIFLAILQISSFFGGGNN